jgi:hypothetical protein
MTDIPEKTHALLSPSGADRWATCPGSVVLEAGREDRGSKYADWGTVCHEVADIILQTAVVFDDSVPEHRFDPVNAEGFIGRAFTVGDKEYEFDHEMADCVNDYIGHVECFWERGDILMPESAVPLTHITGEEGATGTSDCIIIKPSGEIVVIDLKTGKGVQVDADENKQGLMYASGAAYDLDLIYGPFDRVRIVIVQPRLHHVSEWAINWPEFEDRVADLRFAAHAVRQTQEAVALAPDAEDRAATIADWLQPTEKGCRFCKAKAICPALQGEVSAALSLTAPPARADEFPDLSLAKQAAAAVPGDDGVADRDALAKAWKAIPLVEQWIEAVRKETHALLHDGQPVGDLCLYEGRQGNRAWTNEAKAEERMKKARIKADLMYTKSVISVTAAEKLAKAGDIGKTVWADLAEFITRSDGKPAVGVAGDPKKTPWQPCPVEDFPDLDAVDPLFA